MRVDCVTLHTKHDRLSGATPARRPSWCSETQTTASFSPPAMVSYLEYGGVPDNWLRTERSTPMSHANNWCSCKAHTTKGIFIAVISVEADRRGQKYYASLITRLCMLLYPVWSFPISPRRAWACESVISLYFIARSSRRNLHRDFP